MLIGKIDRKQMLIGKIDRTQMFYMIGCRVYHGFPIIFRYSPPHLLIAAALVQGLVTWETPTVSRQFRVGQKRGF